tara:strand:+ start:129 stop:383 length:255 start_codon:yes stop_codon:yes gene_type:complete
MNSISKFEQESFNKMKAINENMAKIIMRLFKGRESKNLFNKAAKIVAKDKNVKAALIDLKHSNERLKDLLDDYCEKYPATRGCK